MCAILKQVKSQTIYGLKYNKIKLRKELTKILISHTFYLLTNLQNYVYIKINKLDYDTCQRK